jgi:proline iminopeptidase
MLVLLPPIKPFAVHQLKVDAIHSLYVEESGNPEGLPVLFLHGGPGIGTDPEQRRMFDPNLFRIILFDQRGAGQSTPHAELEKNTTQDLIEDIEKIRNYLGITRWILFGGSWGSTLALVYAQAYPSNVLAMILRGIFLCREEDLNWFYRPGGANRIFPDGWEDFTSLLSDKEKENILESYYQRLTSEDEILKMSAAKAWCQWEASCATLQPSQQVINCLTHPHVALSMARIETHYFMHKVFLKPNQILQDTHKISEIPGIIIHGRYDMVCPLDNAFALHKAWPASELEIIRDAGHSASEAGIINALVLATHKVAKWFQ